MINYLEQLIFQMNSSQFLVAIALIQEGNLRAMPISGKSLKKQTDDSPPKMSQSLLNELLLRVFQRSEARSIQKVEGDKTILLFEIEMDLIQEKIPFLKREWIMTGDTYKFLDELISICSKIWSIGFVKYEGVRFSTLKSHED